MVNEREDVKRPTGDRKLPYLKPLEWMQRRATRFNDDIARSLEGWIMDPARDELGSMQQHVCSPSDLVEIPTSLERPNMPLRISGRLAKTSSASVEVEIGRPRKDCRIARGPLRDKISHDHIALHISLRGYR